MEVPKCYMCDGPGTTKEHVPPKCLFPEKKDVGGRDFKKELITVPSCVTHNASKTNNDEFLMVCLAGIINNNIVGQNHFQTKVDRALARKEKDFLNKQIIRNLQHKTIKTKDNKLTAAAVGKPNYDRLITCFESIGYGLFYHEFQFRFAGEISVILGFIEYNDRNMETFISLLREKFQFHKDLLEDVKGENQEVFYYQYIKPDEHGLIALKLVFYEQSDVYITFKVNGSDIPQSKIKQLVETGIKSTVKVGDKKFKFNQ